MKTLHQRLQSRISKRRNFIRAEEETLNTLKTQRIVCRKLLADLSLEDSFGLSGLNEEIYTLRNELKGLADDQRLDKQLKNLITYHESLGLAV